MPLLPFRPRILAGLMLLLPITAYAQETQTVADGAADVLAAAEADAQEMRDAAELMARMLVEGAVDDARAEAQGILEAAETEAADILTQAEAAAEARRATADAEAQALADRALAEAEIEGEGLLLTARQQAAQISTMAEAEVASMRARVEEEAEALLAAARAEAAEVIRQAEIMAADQLATSEAEAATAAATMMGEAETATAAMMTEAETMSATMLSEAEAAAAAMISDAETAAQQASGAIVAAAELEASRILEEARAEALLALERERERIAAEEEAARLAAEEAARIAAEEAALAAAEAALAGCLATAGMPNAGVPMSEDAQASQLAALQDAAPDCAAAAEALPDRAGAAFFHLATIAQTSGDHREAIALYEAAYEGGVVPAQTRLGDYYLFGTGPIRPDFDEAATRYTDAAEAGDPAAQTTLGFLHLLGRGVDRDATRMVELMGQAADSGYHFAQFRLGQTYLSGEGIPNRDREALGIPDVIRAAELFEAASENGNAEAALILADLYSGDIEGVVASDEQRFRWTERAANEGDADAMAQLAFLIERGIGTEANPELAARAYVRAIEEGASTNDLRPAGVAWDRPTAVAFQQLLTDRGLYAGALDGIVGAGTLAAARALREN